MPSSPPPLRYGLLVPTLNAGPLWPDFLAGLAAQSWQPARKLLIDSGSTDATCTLAEQAGFEIVRIAPHEFDHGRVRQLGVERLDDCPLVLLVTQDIEFAATDAIERLLAAFANPAVGAAYGRQMARADAPLGERHARACNYPTQSMTKALHDRAALGIRTPFLSNAFAAYRRAALMAIGGFPPRLIFGEDMYAGGKLLLAGWYIGYCSDAVVWHSHRQSLWHLLRRSFDIGVFHAGEPWLLREFRAPERAGIALTCAEVVMTWRECPWRVVLPPVRNLARWGGYRLGRLHHRFPLWFNRSFSLNRGFWRGSHPCNSTDSRR